MAVNDEKWLRLMAMGTACLCMILTVGGLLLYILKNPDSQHISQIMGSWKTGAGFVAVLIIFYRVILAAINPAAPRRERSSKKEL